MTQAPIRALVLVFAGAIATWSAAARAEDEAAPKASSGEPVAAAASAADPHDPAEEPHKTYRFIGLRFRDVVVPKFMINLFADGGATVNVPMVGPELGIRRDHLEYDFAIEYADYSMNAFLFKGHSDGPETYEIVSSSMKLLYFTVDLLYDIPIDKSGRFSFLIGGGVGLAPVFGSLYRNQAYPLHGNNKASPDDVTRWGKCVAPPANGMNVGPGKPAYLASNGKPYCDGSNDHYGGYDEPSWAGGGSKPLLFPWISLPQLSLRYKPLKELETRADLGFSITGFFFGLTAAYGL
ncbi:MAG TPA: hypothetical protein VHB21_23660 [Minicystis sp.]|nr:hypothetical protein [Minicystis sp.]